MNTQGNQRTIAAPAAVEGVGYWSDREVRVEFRPAAADTGIVFVRRDLPGCPRIPALIGNRVETPRRTSLRSGDASVEMIEHVMAALAGLGIDNCELWVDRPEMPGCDGSCLPFVEAIQEVGIASQNAPCRQLAVERVIRVGDRSSWIEARPSRSGKCVLQYELDYGAGNPIGRQFLEISLSPRHFHLNLAPSRTFLLEAEAAEIKARGMGQKATCKDLLVFGAKGPIDNQLRFPDECARHKMVDMVGDLALAGRRLSGRFSAYRSGHRLNGELVRAIVAEDEKNKRKLCA
ncbi:MAG: UDP-3-O-[3-hydroxymyristoyl] N-acetylglucosamine deacetylase [Pirellulales bacterium]|nr:UDP-3-O-[3-hydroxymyristoyl] N-acetylglucosamine deacetylase [Pirellulales bacterium]